MKQEALARLPVSAGLDEDTLRYIVAQSEALAFSEGQVISLEGDPCRSVFLVAQGTVQLWQFSQDGREHILAHHSEGSWIHVAAVLEGRTSLATARALTPVVLYAIEAGRFVRMMDEHPRLAVAVSRCLAEEVSRLTAMVKDLALHSVRTRLARFLLAHAESASPTGRHAAPQTWTQEMIAASIGTVRDVVGRMLRAFVGEGLVRRERGRLVIVDRSRLEREAQAEDIS